MNFGIMCLATMMKTIFYTPMSWFMERPLLALIPAFAFAAAFVHLHIRMSGQSRMSVGAVACLWFVYAVYEWRMQQSMKPENVPIRIDMGLITPVLWVASMLGLVAYLSGLRRRSLSRGFPVSLKADDKG